jgi:hypothetical protein
MLVLQLPLQYLITGCNYGGSSYGDVHSDLLDKYKDILSFDNRFGTVSTSCIERSNKIYTIQQFTLFQVLNYVDDGDPYLD